VAESCGGELWLRAVGVELWLRAVVWLRAVAEGCG
jgi:hypothetical protein